MKKLSVRWGCVQLAGPHTIIVCLVLYSFLNAACVCWKPGQHYTWCRGDYCRFADHVWRQTKRYMPLHCSRGTEPFPTCEVHFKDLEVWRRQRKNRQWRVLRIRMGLSAPMADRLYSWFSSTPEWTTSVRGAGKGSRVGTIIMPLPRLGVIHGKTKRRDLARTWSSLLYWDNG